MRLAVVTTTRVVKTPLVVARAVATFEICTGDDDTVVVEFEEGIGASITTLAKFQVVFDDEVSVTRYTT